MANIHIRLIKCATWPFQRCSLHSSCELHWLAVMLPALAT